MSLTSPVESSVVDAIAGWPTEARVRLYCAALLSASIVVACAAIALGASPFNVFGRPVAEDYVHEAIGARIAAEGRIAEIYDLELQRTMQERILGDRAPTDELNPFVSPPFVALLHLPLVGLPYLGAAAVWVVFSVALLVASLALLRSLLPASHRWSFSTTLLVALSTQPVVELVTVGQDSALSLAILTGGLWLLVAKRDLAAGVILGLGAFKPQIFLLMPWLLMLESRWRAVSGWLAATAGLAILSIALVGTDGFARYLALLESDFYRVGIGEDLRWKMQSLPALAGSLLPPSLHVGGGLFGIAAWTAGAAAILAVSLLRPRRDAAGAPPIALPYALAVLLGACINPHFFIYDCAVLLLPALVLLAVAPEDRRLRAWLLVAYVLLWSAPLRRQLFGGLSWPFSIPGAPWAAIASLAFALIAYERLRSPSLSARR